MLEHPKERSHEDRGNEKILDDVMEKADDIPVTDQVKPAIPINPCPKTKAETPNPLKNSVMFEKDIGDPVDLEWEADT